MIILDLKNKFWSREIARNEFIIPWSSFVTGASNDKNEISSIKFIEKKWLMLGIEPGTSAPEVKY